MAFRLAAGKARWGGVASLDRGRKNESSNKERREGKKWDHRALRGLRKWCLEPPFNFLPDFVKMHRTNGQDERKINGYTLQRLHENIFMNGHLKVQAKKKPEYWEKQTKKSITITGHSEEQTKQNLKRISYWGGQCKGKGGKQIGVTSRCI